VSNGEGGDEPIAHSLIQSIFQQPWEHFIPVRPNFSDLLDKVEWCERHLDICHAVSKRASEYIR